MVSRCRPVFVVLLLVALVSGVAWSTCAVTPEAAARRADELLARMTLAEKIGQTVLLTGYGATTGPVAEQNELETHIRNGDCGSVFNVLGVRQVRALQEIAVRQTRLGIPLLFGFDVVHGYQTIFPICLGEAASWNPALIEQAARVGAVESAAAGLNWTFAPMVDIARDPRWGRISEGAGEDPWLGSVIARARVRGFQGADLAAPDTVLACVKHFAAYGAAQAGRDYHTVDVSERTLRETYLPPFQAALAAGAGSIMTAFNELDGIPATAHPFLLRRILREEWGFEGFVVSDYTSVNEMIEHGTAADLAEAAAQAMRAGLDLDMQGHAYRRHLAELVAAGRVSPDAIHAAARRVLLQKIRLGLLDDPFRYCDEAREQRVMLAPEHRRVAYQMAAESLVLLQNHRQVLPLAPGRRLAVLGPLAAARRDLLGSWCGAGDATRAESILETLRRRNGTNGILHAPGCDVAGASRAGFPAAVAAAEQADAVVLVLGESWDMSGEARSRTRLDLPGVQADLLRAVQAVGKPTVVVLLAGRPLALAEELPFADAWLLAWFPGTEGGRAVADALFGVVEPGGRLPVTFPRHAGQVPIFYNHKNTGRPFDPANPRADYRSTYFDCANDPLFPFGYGLGYTRMAYSPVTLSADRLIPGGTLTASVTVTNTGERPGAEVVQLYLRQRPASVTRPVRELRNFRKIQLAPGEAQTVTFPLTADDLRFLRADMTWGTEPGGIEVFVGPNSRDAAGARFELLAR